MFFSKILSGTPSFLWTKAASLSRYQIAHNNVVSDGLLFLKSWRKDPGKVGAILPSGRALCAAITREISLVHAPVLELGCGTGAFTQKIIDRGIAPEDLILVEVDPFFADHLHVKFPRAHVLCIDACRLDRWMPAGLTNKAGAAVCGLPLRNMSTKQQLRILRGTFGSLRENGALYLFSYGWRCPIPMCVLDRLGLQAHILDTILLNVPAARVWKIVAPLQENGAIADVISSCANPCNRAA